MARYIDADAFKKVIGDETKLRRTICSAIDAQPTAFDMDAVVKQLEKDTTCIGRLEGYIPKSKAINIVRNAGKECVE